MRTWSAGSAVLALGFAFAAVLAGTARADDPRWELPAGGRSAGTLAAGQTHLYVVRLTAGTTYDVTLAGKAGFVPHLDLLDEARTAVATDGALVASGPKTTLRHFLVARTGTYLLRVTGATGGRYTIASQGRPSGGGAASATVASAGATSQFVFQATGGGAASVVVKTAKGSKAVPAIVGVTDPQGAEVALDALRSASKSASCRVPCGTSGAYVVTFGAADATTGALDVSVKVATPKAKAVSLKVDGATRVADFAWFAAKVQPIFQNRGCNASSCHGAVTGQGRMILRGPSQGPFPLDETYWNYLQLSRFVTVGDAQSRALLKPLAIEDGGIYHGGGDVFRKSDPEYQPFLDWCMGSSLASIPPVANAGADVHGFVANAVRLDGSASADAEGQSLAYRWTLVSAPGGSTATLSGSYTATPTLTPDRSGVYLVRLIVTDSSGVASAPGQVAVAADANSQAGVVTFEAEHGAISGNFAVGDDAAASNGKFISRPAGAPQDGVASYLFSVADAGDYAVWGRVLAVSNRHDSLRFRVDDGPVRTWEVPVAGAWTFARANDGMDRRRVVTGSASLDAGDDTTRLDVRAESADVRGVCLTGARMRFGTIDAKIRFDSRRADHVRNAALVFDRLDDGSYLFAGLDDSGGRVVIGSVADGIRTDAVANAFGVAADVDYALRVRVDADGTVHAFVDGAERATFRFDPAVRGVNGGLVGFMTERTESAAAAGRFDDLVVTDSADGNVWSDDFETTPWTDPVTVALDAGEHRLDVLAGESDVELDRLVVAPATLDPADAVAGLRLVRRMYFDAANRSPTNDELLLAPFLTPAGVAQELVDGYGYYQGWYERNLVQFNLVGLNAPKTNDEDWQALSSIPARLTNGEITETQALGEIAKSAAWARLNAGSRDFTYSLFEEFLGREPSATAPAGGRSEVSAAEAMFDGSSAPLFGETGSSAAALVDIVLGLNGRHPDYAANLPGAPAPDTQALQRAQVQFAWTRLVPSTPIAPEDLATWTADCVGSPTAIRATVAKILRSPAYVADARTPRPKSARQLIRGLYMDVLRRDPDLDTVGNLEFSFVSSGDPVPLAGELVQQMLRSPDADAVTPPTAGLDADAWLGATFARTLGRLPTPSERAALGGWLRTSAVTTTDLTLEAIVTSQEYLYY